MKKYTLKVEGMMCGMCEKRVNQAVLNKLPNAKVTSSHKLGETEVIAEDGLLETVKEIIENTGYTVLSTAESDIETKKKGLFSLFNK